MDLKTLSYMEERVVRARNILNHIEKLRAQTNDIKRARGVMDLYTPNKTIRLEASYQERAQDNYITHVVAAIHNAFIDVSNSEIQRLEKLLEEL